jgi:hypothetical protein
MDSGELEQMELLSGKGFTRWCELSRDQMYTFITLRALAASPLMLGGDLPTLDDFSLSLITNEDMLACNQNGVMGELVFEDQGIEAWNAPQKNTKDGWIGIFNRSDTEKSISMEQVDLGLDQGAKYQLRDVWNEAVATTLDFRINPNGAIFLVYNRQGAK